jgi:hypothetical protein
MKPLWLVILPVMVIARAAHADPHDLAIDSKDLAAAMTGLLEQQEEPLGLLAIADNPKLGLARGDIVRAINGQSATRMSLLTDGGAIFYLDVTHGAQAFVVRLAVKLDGAEDAISRDRYRDRVQQLQRFGVDLVTHKNHVFVQVKKAGTPSGVMVRSSWAGFGTLIEGDVIRKIDGVEIATVEQAVDAFARAKNSPEVAITVERLDQTLVKTLRIEDSLKPDPNIASTRGGMQTASNNYEGPDGAELLADPMGSCGRRTTAPKPEIGWSLGVENHEAAPVEVAAATRPVVAPKSKEVAWAFELGSSLGSTTPRSYPRH